MQIDAKNADDYLAQLPADRRAALARVRDVINANLPAGFEERVQWGMISWCVPESTLPAKEVYNKQPLCLAGLASQKNHMAVYLMSVYGDKQLRSWFEKAYKQSGKKLDMGQSCVRFKSVESLPLEVIGEAVSKVSVDQYVEGYRKLRGSAQRGAAKRGKRTAHKGAAIRATGAKQTNRANTTRAKRITRRK